MKKAGLAELKARLATYLKRVKAGDEVLITERGQPVAKLVPLDKKSPLSGGPVRSYGKALQLATALVACAEEPMGEKLVSLDQRLREAAIREGFAVIPD